MKLWLNVQKKIFEHLFKIFESPSQFEVRRSSEKVKAYMSFLFIEKIPLYFVNFSKHQKIKIIQALSINYYWDYEKYISHWN